MVYVSPKIYPRICYGICPAIKILKNQDLPELSSDPPFGGGPDANSGRPCTLIHSPPCRLFIHELFFGPLGLHLLVWSELGRSPPFQPMRALTLPWSRAFILVCEVTLSVMYTTFKGLKLNVMRSQTWHYSYS